MMPLHIANLLRTRRRAYGDQFNLGDFPGIIAAVDFTQASNMWKESSQTTLVDSYGQPIGSALDVSGMGRHLFQSVNNNAPTWIGGIPSAYGSNILTNGTFDSDSDWTKGTGVTISGGVATASGTNGVIVEQTVAGLVAQTFYRMDFDILNRTGGGAKPGFSSPEEFFSRALTNGSFARYGRAETGHTSFRMATAGNGVGYDIDNLQLRAVTTYTGTPGAYQHGVGPFLASSYLIPTFALPCYLLVRVSRMPDEPFPASSIFGMGLSSTTRAVVQNSTSGTGSIRSEIRISPDGQQRTGTPANTYPEGATRTIEILWTSGNIVVSYDGNDITDTHSYTTQTGTNWPFGTGASGGSGAGGLAIIHKGLWSMGAVPTSEDRAAGRAWAEA